MKIIGGEIELEKNEYETLYTDSGRSSLRLILKNIKDKIIGIPDFLCSVIVDILIDENIAFKYYHIKNDLSIDIETLNSSIDVLYVINYWGLKHDYLSECNIVENKIIIEDNVFSPFLENTGKFKYWISYNSYRKFSFCAEGSAIKSNINLNGDYIVNKEAPYVKKKYLAKDKKYNFINNSLYSEEEYLNDFELAENQLDRQDKIYKISNKGIYNIIRFNQLLYDELEIRKKNYSILNKHIKSVVDEYGNFLSFFVFRCKNRDELRKELFKNNIYLPIHWPNNKLLNNNLYKEVISIPLDSRYNEGDMNKIISIIHKYLKNN